MIGQGFTNWDWKIKMGKRLQNFIQNEHNTNISHEKLGYNV
jgi:hypothetical protein